MNEQYEWKNYGSDDELRHNANSLMSLQRVVIVDGIHF